MRARRVAENLIDLATLVGLGAALAGAFLRGH